MLAQQLYMSVEAHLTNLSLDVHGTGYHQPQASLSRPEAGFLHEWCQARTTRWVPLEQKVQEFLSLRQMPRLGKVILPLQTAAKLITSSCHMQWAHGATCEARVVNRLKLQVTNRDGLQQGGCMRPQAGLLTVHKVCNSHCLAATAQTIKLRASQQIVIYMYACMHVMYCMYVCMHVYMYACYIPWLSCNAAERCV